jgi:hypothetical protein
VGFGLVCFKISASEQMQCKRTRQALLKKQALIKKQALVKKQALG